MHVPVLLAPRQDNPLFQEYQVHGTPAYYLLNEHGRIQASGHPNAHDPLWGYLMDAWMGHFSRAEGRIE